MTQVFKESEYYQEQEIPEFIPNLGGWETHAYNGLEGLKADFGHVIDAAKGFPIRSALTVIGFITVLYICFRVGQSFVKIGNRLRG